MQQVILNLNNLSQSRQNSVMSYFYERLESVIKEKGLTFYKLQFPSGIPSAQFSLWKKGARTPSDAEVAKLAAVPELGLSLERLKSWRALDEYSPEALTLALQEIAPELVEKVLKEREGL